MKLQDKQSFSTQVETCLLYLSLCLTSHPPGKSASTCIFAVNSMQPSCLWNSLCIRCEHISESAESFHSWGTASISEINKLTQAYAGWLYTFQKRMLAPNQSLWHLSTQCHFQSRQRLFFICFSTYQAAVHITLPNRRHTGRQQIKMQ